MSSSNARAFLIKGCEDMRVHPSQLIPGCLIISDVQGKTNRPIVPKKTVVESIHIEVLKKFLVQEVEVGSKLMDGKAFVPEEIIQDEKEKLVQEKAPFVDQYLDAVQEYKKMFKSWQSGSPVDIAKVRSCAVPLIKMITDSSEHVFSLHHYSTKDDYFYHHSVAVSLISAFLAKKMNFDNGEVIQVGLAGFLADCGMAKIDPKILEKEGSLTYDQFREVKKHPTYSLRMIEKIAALKDSVKLGVLQHHERLDGSGYPMGLEASKLHRFGRIISVSDMYHAMTSDRVYRAKQSPFKVIEEILQDQFGKFEHKIVKTFVDHMTNFSNGTKVRLSNNQRGEIVFIESEMPTRPMVRLENSDEIIPLKNFKNLFIEETL